MMPETGDGLQESVVNPESNTGAGRTGCEPLRGVRVIEFEAIGPGPLGGRMLVDLGAEVTLVARPTRSGLPPEMTPSRDGALLKGKRVVEIDLKAPDGVARAFDLVSGADALIEGYRPGVMERLGLGPEACAKVNSRLVYARMTGWGQEGPLSAAAGHDLNYIALSGLLSLASPPGQAPRTPPTVLGDAVGALAMVCGIACALNRAQREGRGSIVDAAIVDALTMLSPLVLLLRSTGEIEGGRPSVFHDSPFYDTYACADGRHLSLGAIEPQFYRELLRRIGFDDVDPERQWKRDEWPALKERFRALFASRPLAHWDELLEGTDACYAPVLTLAEAAAHPHNRARGLFASAEDGAIEAARSLRFLDLGGNGGSGEAPAGTETGKAPVTQ